MRYSDLKGFILTGLASGPWEDVFFLAGPDDENTPPGKFVMLTPIGGPGFNTEMLFDGRSWQVLVASEQEDFDDGYDLALEIDRILVSAWSQKIGGLWVTGFTRQGGPPTPLPYTDDADRTRFTCNYIADVQSSVA